VRYETGWLFLYCLYFNVAVNVMMILYTMYMKVYKLVLQKFRIYMFNKRRGRILAHNGMIKRIG